MDELKIQEGDEVMIVKNVDDESNLFELTDSEVGSIGTVEFLEEPSNEWDYLFVPNNGDIEFGVLKEEIAERPCGTHSSEQYLWHDKKNRPFCPFCEEEP